MTQTLQAVTMADVARNAGVSTATVSRVLNGHPRVDPVLAERVHAAAAQVRYVPNGAGRALRRSRSDLYAAIIPDIHNSFFTTVVQAFETVADADGFSVVLGNTQEDPKRELDYIETALSLQVSGVLIAATTGTKASLAKLEQAGVPVVTIDRRVQGFAGDMVTVDNMQIGRLAAEHLLAQGVRAPMVLTGPASVSSTQDRARGFQRALAEAGHRLPDDRLIRVDLLAEHAEAAVIERLSADDQIDAVFSANGPLTSGAFLGLRAMGKQLPDQVALVGVDDDHWTRMVTPQVTVIAQPVEHLGRWAGQLLGQRARGQALEHARIILEPTLVVRESSVRGRASAVHVG